MENMFKALLFAAILVYTQAMVCPLNICDTAKCPPVTDCAGVLTKGFCGCCDICAYPLTEGKRCINNYILGLPSETVCAEDLYCDPLTLSCVRTERKDEIAARRPKPMPVSDVVKQCIADKCYCVNKNGDYIGNYVAWIWDADTMNCNCARDQYVYQQTGLIGKMFSCTANGNYAPIQCTGSVCYCVDLFGNKVGTTTVNIGSIGSLNC